jgi:hypothetical protein
MMNQIQQSSAKRYPDARFHDSPPQVLIWRAGIRST